MKNSLTNFDALWDDASETLHTLCRDTWTSHSEADPGIMLLQAMAYKVLGIHYQREHIETSAYHLNTGLSPEKALTTTPISADDYRRVLLDAVDENDHYFFRDIQIDEAAFDKLRIVYVPDDLFSNVSASVFEKAILDVFKKNRGLGEQLPKVVAAKAIDVEFEFSLNVHAEKLGAEAGLNREYNFVLAAIDRALRPPPDRDAIVDVSILEGPAVEYPNITAFKDAVKMVGTNVCLVRDEWNRVEKSRIIRSHDDIVADRLAAAKAEIEGFSFVHHFAIKSTKVKFTLPTGLVNGDYCYYNIGKKGGIPTTFLTATLERQNNAATKVVNPGDWRIKPISKANNQIFRAREDRSSAVTELGIPTLLEMMPPAYRKFGGPQWEELVSVFDKLLAKVEERDEEIFSFFDALTPEKPTEERDLSFVNWLLRRVGGADISSIFRYHIGHGDLAKRAAAHHVELRRFLPAIVDTMQTRNLARYPKSPFSSLLWFAVGEGWAEWADLKVIVFDDSLFLNNEFIGGLGFKGLHINLITNFGALYAAPQAAITEFASIVRDVMPMHLSWNLIDIKSAATYDEIENIYGAEVEKLNATNPKSYFDVSFPSELERLIAGETQGIVKYAPNGQRVSSI